ncbi:caspase-1-like isoform X2 [Apteryx rowi]|uniref:caspase-1-like isoform X2 n=1 Tax=Apteryx rowi TaxID=308060 RepID=UPI000E1D4954|nr:caspase-1-like isoform X2 [Apteryx rowi]XP_025919484.1 caspase-1-like isoform X2 [Apteryx rowi]
MADKKLLQVRTTFVERVGKPVISGLLDDLLAQRVLSSEEVDTVQDQYTVRADKARCLIDSVRLKGHKASKILIESLRQRDGHLAEELGLGADSGPPGMQLVSPRADVTPGPPASSQGEQWIQQCSLSEYRRICAAEGNQIYPIHLPRATRTRRALLICNIEFEYLSKRCGAEKDVEGMTKLLEGLDYKVETHFNLTSQEMAKALKDFACCKEHQNSDSTFLVLMSHGARAGICGTKSRHGNTDILSLDTIYETFNNKHCQALLDKPKVIIIQACRGEKDGSVLVRDSETTGPSLAPMTTAGLESDVIREVHLESDFACLYSSTPDTAAWRRPQTGSIFIQHLIEQFRNCACNSHLRELFRKVQHSFDKFPQQLPAEERTTLIKKFYLFPGH